jgi:hypothetical protein
MTKNVIVEGWVREVREAYGYYDGEDDTVILTETKDEPIITSDDWSWNAETTTTLSGTEFRRLVGDDERFNFRSDHWTHDNVSTAFKSYHHPKRPFHICVEVEITET